MPNIDLSILNQRQTPAFYADTLANRPAAGFVGRIFVSTNTFAFFRDNGTGWDLIGGPGTGTVTGTGTNGQVTYWNGASTITGSNDLFFDAVNGHLGIGTITPGTALGIDHDQNTLIQLQQTVATNDTRIAFLNNGVGLWRLGTFYNAGANDFALYNVITGSSSLLIDVANNITTIGAYQSNKAPTPAGTPQFVLKNGSNGTRSVLGLIGTEGTNTGSDTFLYNYLDNGTAVPVFRTTRATGNIDFSFSGSFGGKLTVSSATGDNQIQIVGATAPSLRIDNAATGATKRAGLGISTATNNFIQGSADRDFCIFNGSTTASPILFGVYDAGAGNVQEAMRISGNRNVQIGTVVDNGYKLFVNGGLFASSQSIIQNTGAGVFNSQFVIANTTNLPALTQYQTSANAYTFGVNGNCTAFIFRDGGGTTTASIDGATGVYTPLSNINKKKNFEVSNLGLDAVLKLKPTLYNMINQDDSEPKELGLIAQEVKEVISQAYVHCDDFIGINYNPIIVTLIKAIQELNTKIENLKN